MVFPNPADNYVNISIQDAEGKSATIQLLDVNGNVRINQVIDNITSDVIKLDLRKVIDGMYFINISIDGEQSVTKRLVVHHLFGWRIQD